jgi:DNA repair protein RadC
MSAQALQQRLALVGPRQLSDAELLALVVGRDVDLGARLLVDGGGLAELQRAGLKELMSATRSHPLACRIQAALELGRRSVDCSLDRGEPITTPADVYSRLRAQLVALEREELHVLGLDTHNRVVVHFVAALGTVHQVQVDPREVFRRLVREAAHSAIVVHNHPSGSPTPSDADQELTTRLAAAGELVGVRLLDHVVVARSGYFAFGGHAALAMANSPTRQ